MHVGGGGGDRATRRLEFGASGLGPSAEQAGRRVDCLGVGFCVAGCHSDTRSATPQATVEGTAVVGDRGVGDKGRLLGPVCVRSDCTVRCQRALADAHSFAAAAGSGASPAVPMVNTARVGCAAANPACSSCAFRKFRVWRCSAIGIATVSESTSVTAWATAGRARARE